MTPEAAIAKKMKGIKAMKLKEERKKVRDAEREAKARKKVRVCLCRDGGWVHPSRML